MHVANAFSDSILILFSSEAVMLKVVYHFEPENTLESVPQLEFEAAISEKVMYCITNSKMDQEVVYHSVLSQLSEDSNVVSTI